MVFFAFLRHFVQAVLLIGCCHIESAASFTPLTTVHSRPGHDRARVRSFPRRNQVQRFSTVAGGWGPATNSTLTAPPSWRKSASQTTGTQKVQKFLPEGSYKIYCDMDGVLVDFEAGVQRLVQVPTRQLEKETMWKHIAETRAFFEDLSWTRDGKELWNGIRHLKPDILTGVPAILSSRIEKVQWCQRELGLEKVHHVDMAGSGHDDHHSTNGCRPKEDATNIITCWSNNKHRECDERS